MDGSMTGALHYATPHLRGLGARTWYRAPRVVVAMVVALHLIGSPAFAEVERGAADDPLEVAPAPARRSGPLIAYTSADLVTVAGSWESLQSVVEELCSQADIRLIEYRAPDRPVRVQYYDMPLSTVLERLLREENYMVGFGSSAAASHTSWLRIIGARDGRTIDSAASGAAPAAASTAAAGLPAALMSEFPTDALSMSDERTRNEMVTAFASILDDDRTVRGRFLSTPDAQLSDALKSGEFGRQVAVRLRAIVRDAAVRGKVSRIMARLHW